MKKTIQIHLIKKNKSLSIIFLTLLTLFVFHSCNNNPYKQGQVLFNNYCAPCHSEDGSGLRNLIPPLANSDYLKKNKDQLVCIIRNGLVDTIYVNGQMFDEPMEGIPSLNDVEIANIINYIDQKWNYELGYFSKPYVKKALENCSQ